MSFSFSNFILFSYIKVIHYKITCKKAKSSKIYTLATFLLREWPTMKLRLSLLHLAPLLRLWGQLDNEPKNFALREKRSLGQERYCHHQCTCPDHQEGQPQWLRLLGTTRRMEAVVVVFEATGNMDAVLWLWWGISTSAFFCQWTLSKQKIASFEKGGPIHQ